MSGLTGATRRVYRTPAEAGWWSRFEGGGVYAVKYAAMYAAMYASTYVGTYENYAVTGMTAGALQSGQRRFSSER